MKIAFIGSFGSKYPLVSGQIHAPLSLTYGLAKAFSEKGHEVTFFGSYGEELKGESSINFEDFGYKKLDKEMLESGSEVVSEQLKMIYEQDYIAKAFAKADEFDLFYGWSGFRIAPLAKLCGKPVVVTHHDSTNLEKYELMFSAAVANNFFMIYLSEYMKKLLPFDNSLGVAYHGLDENEIKYQPGEDYYAWVGRIVPSKGLDIAIKLAKKHNFKLKVAGPVDTFRDFGDMRSYGETIMKEIEESPNIEYLGVLNQEQSRELIGRSKGLIFPSDGTESFGLVMIEAILAGAPVIASSNGPIPEIVEEGKTGFICNSEADYDQAIENINTIDRSKCREKGLKKFSLTAMADRYEELFKQAIERAKS